MQQVLVCPPLPAPPDSCLGKRAWDQGGGDSDPSWEKRQSHVLRTRSPAADHDAALHLNLSGVFKAALWTVDICGCTGMLLKEELIDLLTKEHLSSAATLSGVNKDAVDLYQDISLSLSSSIRLVISPSLPLSVGKPHGAADAQAAVI